MTVKASPYSPSTRRYDLDWLRTLAVLLLVPFHALLIFVQDPNSVVYMKDTVDCFACDKVAGFIHQYHMPILFIIAGMSSAFALSRRSGWQYLKERFFRLFIPLVFGILVLVPPMTYLYRLSQGESLTFWQHYAGFFALSDDLTGRSGTFTPTHLWFILFLVLFSVVGLPFFLLLRAKFAGGFLRGIGWFFRKPMALLVLGLIIAAAGRTEFLGDTNPIYYFAIFFVGFLFMTDERYQDAVDRDWPVYLALGVVLEILRQTGLPHTADNTLPRAIRDVAMEFNRWVWVLAILGLGRRFLNFNSRALTYLSEAAYPFYILHFLVLTSVTYVLLKVIEFQAPVLIKYLLIITITYALTFLVYEGLSRIPLMRFLLGMKAHKPVAQEVKKGAAAPVA